MGRPPQNLSYLAALVSRLLITQQNSRQPRLIIVAARLRSGRSLIPDQPRSFWIQVTQSHRGLFLRMNVMPVFGLVMTMATQKIVGEAARLLGLFRSLTLA
jgi:hypothetical protein